MEHFGLRGSSPTRVDDKGRLKLPTTFRGVIQDHNGPDVFVTSVTGESVRIYPMAAWIELERKLVEAPGNHPSILKFLDRVSYYGQSSELDVQGRVVIPAQLRESASIIGEVRVLGRISYLEVWNEERYKQRLADNPWTDEDGLKLSEFGI